MRLATPQKWATVERGILHYNLSWSLPEDRRGAWLSMPWLGTEGGGGVCVTGWGGGVLKHNKTRCDYVHVQTFRRILTLKLNPSLQLLESHFLPPSVRVFFINTLQPPDFQWLSSDLRWPPYTGWQYNKRNGVMKSRNSISTLLASHIPARAGRGFIICYPLSPLSWELPYWVCVCARTHALNV